MPTIAPAFYADTHPRTARPAGRSRTGGRPALATAGLLARLGSWLDARAHARRDKAIADLIQGHGGTLTDGLEREIGRRFLA